MTANKTVGGDAVDVQALDAWRDIVEGGAERRRLCGALVEDVPR